MSDAALWSAVAMGGALGALLRGGFYRWLAAPPANAVPADGGWLGLGRATLAVNLAGSLLLGLFVAILSEVPATDPMRIFWLTGFCGSLTTFSTFCADAIHLAGAQGHGPVLRYLLSHGVFCLIAFSTGVSLAT